VTTTTGDDVVAARGRHPTSRRPEPQGGPSGLFMALAFLVAVFNLFGLVMVMSASSVVALDDYGSSWYFVVRQALWAGVGAGLMILVARVDYRRFRRYANALLLGAFVMLGLVLVPGVGQEINGAQRWIAAGPLSFQPAELAKFALLVWIADLLARRSALMHNTRATIRPVLLAVVAVATLVMLQPNLGTTMVLASIALALLFVAGAPLTRLTAWGLAGAGVATVLAIAEPYRRARVLSFTDVWADPDNAGYQGLQSLVGLASGGAAGTGLGASRAKWGFLPYAHTDFIFAIIGEELGMVGTVLVVGLFGLLGIIGIRIAMHAPDRFGFLLAVGVTSWFLVQAFVNIGAVIGILPITGVPLPFVSAGGSSLVFSMAAAGLLLSVARRATDRPRSFTRTAS
jgi:cell division protein FtsW